METEKNKVEGKSNYIISNKAVTGPNKDKSDRDRFHKLVGFSHWMVAAGDESSFENSSDDSSWRVYEFIHVDTKEKYHFSESEIERWLTDVEAAAFLI